MRQIRSTLVIVAVLGVVLAGCGAGGIGAAPKTPLPSAGVSQDGKVLTVVQNGSDFRDPYEPKGSKINLVGDSVEMVSTRDALYDASVEYFFDMDALPDGSKIAQMDVAVCGQAKGDFWEFYGPDAEPYEREVEPPEDDGCWHFVGADGSDPSLVTYVYQDTHLLIDRLVWTITLA